MSYTQGPWYVTYGRNGYIIQSEHGYDVAVVRNIGNEDNNANAELLAAAPLMAHALDEGKDSVLANADHHPYCKLYTARRDGIQDKVPCNCWVNDLVQEIDSVLKKAGVQS